MGLFLTIVLRERSESKKELMSVLAFLGNTTQNVKTKLSLQALGIL